ncbi:MAG: hypothetical protein QOH21_3332, partial [Acidobacteriota bacterium]|nr:hypothetical protein [Acidobacteriota bacterium]
EARRIIDRMDCINMQRYDWSIVSRTADAAAIDLDIHGSMLPKAAGSPYIDFPRRWRLDLVRTDDGWKIEHAFTAERMVARAMRDAPSYAEAERIFLAASDVDTKTVLIEYADRLYPDVAGDIDRADFARQLAFAHGGLKEQVFTIRAQAILRVQNQLPGARELAREANALAQARGTGADRAEALFTLGVTTWLTGDTPGARPFLLASANLVEETDDPILSLKSLHMYNYVSASTGDLRAALDGAGRLVQLAQHYGWPEGEEVATFLLAIVYDQLRNDDMSLELLRKTRRLAEANVHDAFIPDAVHDIAIGEAKLGDVERAIATMHEAIGLFGQDSSRVWSAYVQLARFYMQLGRLDAADQALQKSASSFQPNDADSRSIMVMSHRTRSELRLLQGRAAEAVEAATVAVATTGDPEDKRYLAEQVAATIVLGRAFRAAGRKEEAQAALREGIARFEASREDVTDSELSRIAFFADNLQAYVELAELLVEQHDVEGAFRIAEQMKGRGLRDVLARGRIDLGATLTADERKRQADLEARIIELNRAITAATLAGGVRAELRERLAVARIDLDAFQSEMRLRHASVARQRVDGNDVIALPAQTTGTVLVEYVIGERQTTAFTLRRDTSGKPLLQAVRIPIGREALQHEVESFDRLVASRSLRYAEPARRLYDLLLAPLEAQIAGSDALCIVPDGVLWTLPFHALMPSAGTHLVDRRPVYYAQSLALLRHSFARDERTAPTLLAFGNPTIGAATRSSVRSAYRDVPMGALPDAEDEVRSLSSLYAPKQRRTYWRDAAREAVFKDQAEHFDIIHIAAHAIVDDGAPMYSAILLATGANESEDGLLEAREVVGLQLNARLAVLSACDTARGRVGAGEGVVGIAWAFFAAGCPTTVVSQWKAESRATAKLMVEFHRRLVAGDSTAQALRAAQRALRATPAYSHPFYWAPFVAIGAAGARK